MRRFSRLIVLSLVCVVAALAGPARPAQAYTDVDVSFFYDRLGPYGNWVHHRHHGWVWFPSAVPVGWRPYTHGHWVWTTDYGWLWVSHWDWGWAPFHYGRWVWDEDYGWIWRPGHDWGPAWVTWRRGGGYIGWAPLPPTVSVTHIVVSSRRAEFEHGLLDISWVFVQERSFLAPRVHASIVLPARNVTIIRHTTNVTNYVKLKNVYVNRSVRVRDAERFSGRKVTATRVSTVDTPSARNVVGAGRNEVGIFRPSVRSARPDAQPPARGDVDRLRAIRQEELRERHRAEEKVLDRRQASERARQPAVPAPRPPAQPQIQRPQLQQPQQRPRSEQPAQRTPRPQTEARQRDPRAQRQDEIRQRQQLERRSLQQQQQRELRQFERRYGGQPSQGRPSRGDGPGRPRP